MNDDVGHGGCTETWCEKIYIFGVGPYGSMLKWDEDIIPEKSLVMLVIVVVIIVLVVNCKLIWWKFVVHIIRTLHLSSLHEWNMSYICICYWPLVLWITSQKSAVFVVTTARNINLTAVL
jgi:hypothetical protein